MRIDVLFKCSMSVFAWKISHYKESYIKLYDFLQIDEDDPRIYTFHIYETPRDESVKEDMKQRYNTFLSKCIINSIDIKSFTVTM